MSPSTDLQHLRTLANGVRRTYSGQTSGWRVVAAGAALANRVSEDVQQRPVLPPGQAPGKRLRQHGSMWNERQSYTPRFLLR